MRLKGKLPCERPLKQHHLDSGSSCQQDIVYAGCSACKIAKAGLQTSRLHTCPPEQPKAMWCWLPLLQVVSSGMATPGLSSCSKKENFFQPKPMAISRLAFESTIYSVRAAYESLWAILSHSKNPVIMTISYHNRLPAVSIGGLHAKSRYIPCSYCPHQLALANCSHI